MRPLTTLYLSNSYRPTHRLSRSQPRNLASKAAPAKKNGVTVSALRRAVQGNGATSDGLGIRVSQILSPLRGRCSAAEFTALIEDASMTGTHLGMERGLFTDLQSHVPEDFLTSVKGAYENDPLPLRSRAFQYPGALPGEVVRDVLRSPPKNVRLDLLYAKAALDFVRSLSSGIPEAVWPSTLADVVGTFATNLIVERRTNVQWGESLLARPFEFFAKLIPQMDRMIHCGAFPDWFAQGYHLTQAAYAKGLARGQYFGFAGNYNAARTPLFDREMVDPTPRYREATENLGCKGGLPSFLVAEKLVEGNPCGLTKLLAQALYARGETAVNAFWLAAWMKSQIATWKNEPGDRTRIRPRWQRELVETAQRANSLAPFFAIIQTAMSRFPAWFIRDFAATPPGHDHRDEA